MTQAALIFQLQQLQQQLQAAAVATASQQHQQTEQLATASGGLTLALHHTTVSTVNMIIYVPDGFYQMTICY